MKRTIFSPAKMRPYSDREIAAVGETLKSGHLSVVFGRQTVKFETEFAKHMGVSAAVAVSSGSSALEVALHVLGVGYGDEVILPAYTFGGVVSTVMRNLAVVRFADIDRDSWNISVETIEAQINAKTRAVIVPHMFGNPADIEQIVVLATKHNIFVIEDCAQAAGAEVNGKKVGSFGDIGCFSFNEIKNLTTGEGGMVVANNRDLVERGRLLRLHATKNGLIVDLGGKCTMTEMEAALGRNQLSSLNDMNDIRRESCRYLLEQLSQIPGISSQKSSNNAKHVYSRFVVRIDKKVAGIDRDTMVNELKQKGYGVDPVYPTPLYRHPLFQSLSAGTPQVGLATSYHRLYQDVVDFTAYPELVLPETEKFCLEQFGFIVPPDIHLEEAKDFIEAIRDVQCTYHKMEVKRAAV